MRESTTPNQRPVKNHFKTYDRICPACGQEFTGYHSMVVYCSKDCRNKDWARARRKERKAQALQAPGGTDERARERLKLTRQ